HNDAGKLDSVGHLDDGSRPEEVVHGSLEDGFPSTVSLGVAYLFSACTGNLITPNLVLTAGHCGGDLPLKTIVAFGTANFGSTIKEPDESINFVNLTVHPDYKPLQSGLMGSLGKYDFAILELEWEASVQPLWFNTTELTEDEVGLELTSVGFGVNELGESGIKRSAELTIDEITKMFVVSRNEGNTGGANICSGDSGGPMFYFDGEQHTQWAVHSWADENCQDSSGSTRTDVASDWILEQIEAVHGTTDRCEINGHYDNGVCDEFCDDIDPDCIDDVEEETPRACGCTSSGGKGAWIILVLAALGWRHRRIR
ncbi:MAG: trypsin-like serine protease, partial [Proteobacteria bacterium]|nr:trypsin-like serine protease [Pseudomonadota bacterium]